MSDLPRGTVTFLFTDIEGSTRLWERDRAAMCAAVDRHFALLDDAMATHHGVRYKTIGDAVQAAFPTAADAVAGAVAAQRALLAAEWGALGPLRVRMALHTSEATPDVCGDYLAASLNRLARVLASGHGGQILLTETVQQLARGTLPEEVTLRDLGVHRLRDLLEPERIWQVLAPGLETTFPPLATLEGRLHNLPRQPTPFLGREQAVAELAALLRRDEVQLVTLTGPGGTGKTRLAIQVAAELLDAFPDGVFFVDLAPLTEASMIDGAIGVVVGVRSERAGSAFDALVAVLRERRVLLVLDNFEHLLSGATMVGGLLRACQQVKVLTTSRSPLRLRAEREIPVPPLVLPDPSRREPVERLTQYEAVRLFIERAVAAKPDFAVDNENAPAVAELCARLDGLPLAIELAAVRIKLLPPAALLRRLEHSLSLLTTGAQDTPQRQRTLRDAIAWSHDLLSVDEQRLFRRLGVFGGGCTLEAAEAVTNLDGDLVVFNGLASLVDDNLVRQVDGPGGEPRFRLLETIREFALEQLVASGEEDAVRRQLAGWFVEQAEEISTALDSGVAREMAERLEVEHANLTAALGWLKRSGQAAGLLRLAGAMGTFWYLSGRYAEGRAWLEQALAQAPEATAERARALTRAGVLAYWSGDHQTAAERLEQAAAMAHCLGLPHDEAAAILERGVVDEDCGEYATAEARFSAARDLYRQIGARLGAATATYHLGVVAYGRGEAANARQRWEEALTSARAEDDAILAGWCLEFLGLMAADQGDLREAGDRFRALLALRQPVARRHHQGDVLHAVAVLGAARGQFELSARLQGAAAALGRHAGDAALPERLAYDRAEAKARAALGDENFARACAEGSSFRPEDVLAAVEKILEAGHGRGGLSGGRGSAGA